MLEAARGGASYEAVEAAGLAAVQPGEVMDGVATLLDEVRLEVLLGDGSRLIVLVDPLGTAPPTRSSPARSASPRRQPPTRSRTANAARSAFATAPRAWCASRPTTRSNG